MPVVYIDVVWVVNFAMDFSILLTTAWIAKCPFRWWRLGIGALIGATYALLLFVPPLSTLTTWYGKAVTSLIMVSIAIPSNSWLRLAKVCALFYLVAFVFAGGALAMHFAWPGVSLAKGTVITGRGLAFTTSLSSLGLLVAVPLSAALIQFGVRRIQRQQVTAQRLLEVVAVWEERQCTFVGLLDTGNQLRDPLSRRPVCLVDGDALIPLLPADLTEVLAKMQRGEDWLDALTVPLHGPWMDRLCLVPFRGAGSNQSLTFAVRADSMFVKQGDTVNPIPQPPLLAVHTGRFSTDGLYQAILHTEAFTGVDLLEDAFDPSQVERETTHSSATHMDPDSYPTRGRSG